MVISWMPNRSSTSLPQVFVRRLTGVKAASRPGMSGFFSSGRRNAFVGGGENAECACRAMSRMTSRASLIQPDAGFAAGAGCVTGAGLAAAESGGGEAVRGAGEGSGLGGKGIARWRRTRTGATIAPASSCPGAVRNRSSRSRCANTDRASARENPGLMACPRSCFCSPTCGFWQALSHAMQKSAAVTKEKS